MWSTTDVCVKQVGFGAAYRSESVVSEWQSDPDPAKLYYTVRANRIRILNTALYNE